ncbi:MAG: DUF3565 domain-containing protein [Pseudomonadota bacterium]
MALRPVPADARQGRRCPPGPSGVVAVERAITGFHRDRLGDWVAELACGHCRHVQHNPPWQNRLWVQTRQGRAEMLGYRLHCRECERGGPIHAPPEQAE